MDFVDVCQNNYMAIHLSCARGDMESTAVLLDGGADPNTVYPVVCQ